MDSQIIGALINAVATIIAAVISWYVAIKVAEMTLQSGGKTQTPIEKQANRKLSRIIGALVGGGFVIGGILLFNSRNISIPPLPPTPMATVSPMATISPMPTRIPTPLPKIMPQPTTTPQPKSIPTTIPTVKPTPTPTRTPLPSPTPVPTRQPTKTPTPKPTSCQFHVNRILIESSQNRITEYDTNMTYPIKRHSTIEITVDVVQSSACNLWITWQADYGEVGNISELTNAYIAQEEGGDTIRIFILDRETGQEDNRVVTLNVIP